MQFPIIDGFGVRSGLRFGIAMLGTGTEDSPAESISLHPFEVAHKLKERRVLPTGMIQPYTQTTYESCLACCLLQGVGLRMPITITREAEFECLLFSLRFSKEDFVLGHLEFVARRFNISTTRIVEENKLYRRVRDMKCSAQIETQQANVEAQLLEELLTRGPVITYLDAFHLFGCYHYPHFVTVLRRHRDTYVIFDTWDGLEKRVLAKKLWTAIDSLRTYLRFSPQLLLVGA
jgi:hypothetical protein